MRIYIFGPQGVGKTTISKQIADKFGFSQFSSSDIMMKICGVENRNELKSLNGEFKRKQEDRYYLPFLENYEDIIVDGHGSLNEEQVRFFDLFICLECAPDVLYERRKKDLSRNDRELNMDSINMDLYQYMEKCQFLVESGITVHVIDNSEEIENAITDIENKIQEIKSEVANESIKEYNTDIALN